MKPAFFTLGRTMTQLARPNMSGGTVLPSIMALSTVEAFLSVSSSLALSATKTAGSNNTDKSNHTGYRRTEEKRLSDMRSPHLWCDSAHMGALTAHIVSCSLDVCTLPRITGVFPGVESIAQGSSFPQILSSPQESTTR
jgi:hypothetical protein